MSKDVKGEIEQHFSFIETPNKVENIRQRHLHSKIINNFESANKRSPLKPDMKIRLKRNLKQKNIKLIQNKPENSELRDMFLKIVEKRNPDLTKNDISKVLIEQDNSFKTPVRNNVEGLETSTLLPQCNPRSIFSASKPILVGFSDKNSTLMSNISSEKNLSDKDYAAKAARPLVDGSIVGTTVPDFDLSKSDRKVKETSLKKRKTVKEIRAEIERKSMRPIESFFERKDKIFPKNANKGQSNEKQ